MRIRLPKNVVWTKLGEEVAILNSATGTYFGLDPVGSKVWCLVVEGRSLDEVVSTVLQEYQVAEAQVRSDVSELIDQLVARSLVEISHDEKSPE